MIDTALCIIQKAREDEVNWEELERSGSDEAEAGISEVGPRDLYGVPLAPCFVCEKADVGTRLTSCEVCYKRLTSRVYHGKRGKILGRGISTGNVPITNYLCDLRGKAIRKNRSCI